MATQWKVAFENEKRQREEMEQQFRQARNNLMHEMENVKEQHQTELLRQELAHHQQEQLRLVQQLRMRQGMPPSSALMDGSGPGGMTSSLFSSQPMDHLPHPQEVRGPGNTGTGKPLMLNAYTLESYGGVESLVRLSFMDKLSLMEGLTFPLKQCCYYWCAVAAPPGEPSWWCWWLCPSWSAPLQWWVPTWWLRPASLPSSPHDPGKTCTSW